MIIHAWRILDSRENDIPDCEVDKGTSIKTSCLFENELEPYQAVTQISLPLYKRRPDKTFFKYGLFKWSGSCALRADQIYEAVSESVVLPVGMYVLSRPVFETASSAKYYCNDPFKMTFRKY